jgi:hypothetical protein
VVLDASAIVTDQRQVWYGFEWLIHTAVARYIINNAETLGIDRIRIGRADEEGRKPDLSFEFSGISVLIEFKTFSQNSFSYCNCDRVKLAAMTGHRYIAVCGYRKGRDKLPPWQHDTILPQIDINDRFRVVISRLP